MKLFLTKKRKYTHIYLYTKHRHDNTKMYDEIGGSCPSFKFISKTQIYTQINNLYTTTVYNLYTNKLELT